MNGYARVDGALYYTFNNNWTAQLNLENITDNYYYEFGHNDTNITPSAPVSYTHLTLPTICSV